MPAPDYEDDLAFEQRKTESLTDDWKEGSLCCIHYWVKLINDDITIGFFDGLEFSCCKNFCIKEVLAPCDYEELKRLKEENEELKKENIENLGYIGGLFNEGSNLLNLLKVCKKEFKDISTMACYPDTNLTKQADFDSLFNKCEDILTRINTAIGKEE